MSGPSVEALQIHNLDPDLDIGFELSIGNGGDGLTLAGVVKKGATLKVGKTLDGSTTEERFADQIKLANDMPEKVPVIRLGFWPVPTEKNEASTSTSHAGSSSDAQSDATSGLSSSQKSATPTSENASSPKTSSSNSTASFAPFLCRRVRVIGPSSDAKALDALVLSVDVKQKTVKTSEGETIVCGENTEIWDVLLNNGAMEYHNAHVQDHALEAGEEGGGEE